MIDRRKIPAGRFEQRRVLITPSDWTLSSPPAKPSRRPRGRYRSDC
jgi:hypothetical protein